MGDPLRILSRSAGLQGRGRQFIKRLTLIPISKFGWVARRGPPHRPQALGPRTDGGAAGQDPFKFPIKIETILFRDDAQHEGGRRQNRKVFARTTGDAGAVMFRRIAKI